LGVDGPRDRNPRRCGPQGCFGHADRNAAPLGRSLYLATLTDDAFVKNLLVDLCAEAGVAITLLPPTLRLRSRGDLTFAFNLAETHAHAPAPVGAVFVIGGAEIEPFGVAVWR